MANIIAKKVVLDQPKYGDESVYNFQTTASYSDEYVDSGAPHNYQYQLSKGLPKSNDKFQDKDLYTTSVGDPMNEKILDRNLKYEAENSITINNLYISNAGVGGTVKNNRVVIWLFSEEAYGKNPLSDGYSALKSKLNDNPAWVVYASNFGNASEGSDLGSISAVENIPIISNFAGEVENIRNGAIEFPGGSGFNPLGDAGDTNEGGAFELNTIQGNPVTNNIINESVSNPLYIVVYTRGDKKVAWPIKTDSRKRKYSVYKISNFELFDEVEGVFGGKVVTLNFNSPDGTKTGEGGGGAQASAWKVSQFQMTINTSAGIKNDFADVTDYLKEISEVLPPIPVVENSVFSFEFLSMLNPKNQLYNTFVSGLNMTGTTGDGIGNEDYPPDPFQFPNYTPIAKITPIDVENNLTDVDLQSFYEDNQNKAFRASAPSTISFRLAFKLRDVMLGINGAEYVNYNNYNRLVFMDSAPNDVWGDTTNVPVAGVDHNPKLSFAEGDYFYFVIDWDDKENKIKTIDDYIENKPDNKRDYLEKTQDNLYVVKKVTQGKSTIHEKETDTVLSHTYSTPGIKTIKIIVISSKVAGEEFFDETENPDYISNNLIQLGRWKLVTCRFYLDIPIDQYPDFGQLGGSEYTTIPWPNTSPVIGGVSQNSSYKISVQNTLSSGKIGDTDIIDEKFLVNDLENDELGENIDFMDLEQVRYFNQSYDMNTLLKIPSYNNKYEHFYWEISGSSIKYFPSFPYIAGDTVDTDGDGQFTSEDYPFSNNGDYFNGSGGYSSRKFPEESSVGQIFISDNQDLDLRENCILELNTGELVDKSIYDSSGNSNKGLLIGDYKVKKSRKGEPMRRDSFIKVPKKTSNSDGAL